MGRNVRVTRLRAGAFLAVAAIGATAVGAFAYFLGTGTGTGSVSVGSAPTEWAISVTACPAACADGSTATGGALTPGVNSDELDVSVQYLGSGTVTLQSVTGAMTADAGGGVYDLNSHASADSCLASWFAVGSAAPYTAEAGAPPVSGLSHGNTWHGYVVVTMPANASVDQSACEGLQPQVTFTAAG
jgi:hypothetical protein